MNIYRAIEEVPYKDNTYVTMGTFDGIHIGHKKIIEQLIHRSQRNGYRSVLVTFYPHPQTVLGMKDDRIKILTPLDEKIDILQSSQLDSLIILPFTKKLANMTPETFVYEIFVQRIGVKKLIIGYNHSFGRSRAGNDKVLNRLGKHFGFSVDVMPPIKIDNKTVSSTRIRQLLIHGKLSEANRLLGRNYSLKGAVVPGKQLGNKLGFPTANIEVIGDSKLIPKDGVYAVFVFLEGVQYQGMVNIGYKPTFRDKERSIEVSIHNFSDNIYGKQLSLDLVHRIRDVKKFRTINELQLQIESDRIHSINLLAKNSRRISWG